MSHRIVAANPPTRNRDCISTVSGPGTGGICRHCYIRRQRVTIVAWGYLSGGKGRVIIDTDLPIRSTTMHRQTRPNVVAAMKDPSLGNAGIEIRLALQSVSQKKDRRRLCIWTDDLKYGRRLLYDVASAQGQLSFFCDAAVGAAR